MKKKAVILAAMILLLPLLALSVQGVEENSSVTSVSVWVNNTAPVVQVVSIIPDPAEVGVSTLNITANVTDVNGAPETISTVTVSLDNGTKALGDDPSDVAMPWSKQGSFYNSSQFTIPTGGTIGTWTVNVTAIDTGGARHNQTQTFVVQDTTNPNVTDLGPEADSTYNLESTVYINATVIENGLVSFVYANISWTNDGGGLNYTNITLNRTGLFYNVFNGSFTETYNGGTYNITIIANDTENNINRSEITNFTMGDTEDPVINYISDDPDPVDPGDIINISANVTDNSAVDTVFVTINDAANYTMTKMPGDPQVDMYNYSGWDTNVSPGSYDYDVYANDTAGRNATISSGTFTVNTEVSLTLSQTPVDFGNVSIPITNWQAFNGTTGTGHPQAGAARGYPTATSNTGNVAENFSIRGSTNLSGAVNTSYAIGIGNITWANNSNTTAVKLSTTDTLFNWNIAMGDYSNIFFLISLNEGLLSQTYQGTVNVSATKYSLP